jgi:2-polyprenyl-3-methyl-5-hydroxy-6-metoxy-1,4-benzoquinol methylase
VESDPLTLQSFAIALRWERRYRMGEHLSGDGAFCPVLADLDPDFAGALQQYQATRGKLLEIGAGVGLQAIRYAQAGFEVTATDVSATAIGIAHDNAARHGIAPSNLKLMADNILVTSMQEEFDVVADRGCLATLKHWEQADYARNVRRLLRDTGLFLLKLNAGQHAKAHALASHFSIEKSMETFYHGSHEQGPPALFFVLKPLPRNGQESA